jgi:V/A-type H+-transporting ATPase subunit C
MMLRVFRYAFGSAKVMALKSRLLSPEDYHFLLRVRTAEDFLTYLTTTAYGPVLTGWDWRAPGLEGEFTRRLYGELAQAFLKVARGLKKREANFVAALAGRLVAENLKVALRARHQKLPPTQAVKLLLPLGRLTPLNFTALLNQETVEALVDYLAPTPWGPALARGLPRYLREGSLFPLEMSLDLFVFDSLWQGLRHLSRPDRRLAGQLLGTLADITNIIWVGRFREIYGFPPEESYQYLLAAGSFRDPRRRRDLAFAPDLAELLLRLPPQPYGDLLAGAADLAEVEARLSRHWLEALERVLSLAPFQIGLPITYLFLKELEVQNLITLLTGLLLRVPADRLSPLLRGRPRGGGYV